MNCKSHCKDYKQYAMGYLYINKKLNFKKVKKYIRKILAKSKKNKRMRDLIDKYKFDSIENKLNSKGKYDFVVDFHFLKGTESGEYKYQPCHTEKGDSDDKRSNPKTFKPTPSRKDYFGKKQLIAKMCCCKDKKCKDKKKKK